MELGQFISINSVCISFFSGISGGERKRLNVASEVSTMPTVLFADEPTTGLDSFMAESVVQVLNRMADSGRTVIATIHQPSSKIFELFHEVCLLRTCPYHIHNSSVTTPSRRSFDLLR